MKIRNYADVTDRILEALRKSDRLTVWHQEYTTSTYPLYCLRYTAQQKSSPLIYVSAGIHGDEPAAVECALRLVELLVDSDLHNRFPFPLNEYNWLISPCDNPYGYERDIRENSAGFDLNRMFETPTQCPETAFIAESLQRKQCAHPQNTRSNNTIRKRGKIELALDLHEDSESDGFYLWERRTSQCLPIGNVIVKNVAGLCSINQEPLIEDHRNENGVVTLLDQVTTKGWTRGRYLAEQVNTRCLILETPTQLDWETRIAAHLMAIQTAAKHAL
ncbi:MAG: M14 family metallocarboxypeptidase [Candidatus Poribacteria bacterium]|nr:M14 family metallocarboxypeptidase [Candidatus Poribacteria bacterium]